MQKSLVEFEQVAATSVQAKTSVDDGLSLAAVAARFACLALVVSIPPICLFLDLKVLGNSLSEQSVTEITQLVFLLLSISCFALLAIKRPDDRSFALLAAAFFACMLIRELDALFDLIAHGLWKYLVAPIALVAIGNALKHASATLHSLSRFVCSQAGLLMLVAVAILLFYSRLMGMTGLWQNLMTDGYVRIVKNAVEESAELLGYSLILAASVRYLLHCLRQRP